MTTNPTPGNPVRPKVLVTSPLPGRGLERLQATTDLHCWDRSPGPTPEQLRELIRDCEGLLCILTDTIDQALLDRAPRLRVVSSCSVGVDHVDVAALSERGIPLGHTPGVLTDATADLTFGLLLACARRIAESDHFVRGGDWTPDRRWSPGMMLGMDLQGATLGLIGLGPIGQAVARRAQGFGLRVVGWTPSGRSVSGVTSLGFNEVLEQSDILSLHLALSERSRRLINGDALRRLRKGALLINTARGGLIDEAALVSALQNGHLGGAGLDVFEQEPIPAGHPLLALPNVVMTPHIGSATLGTRIRMADRAVDNLLAGLRGEPLPFCVHPATGAMNDPAATHLPATVTSHLRGLRHIGLVTPELDALVDRLRSIFGLAAEDIVSVAGPDARFAFLSIGSVPYEVIEPTSERFRELLLGRDRGINHVCYNVVDLTGAVAAMAAAGVRLGHVTPDGIVEMPHARMAYFDPADTGGLLIEFVETLR